jgi:hypothetical protein
MKFYNLTKLNVNAGDTVQNEEGNHETIHQLTKELIVTDDGDWQYSLYGIRMPVFIPDVIANIHCRIYTHEIL